MVKAGARQSPSGLDRASWAALSGAATMPSSSSSAIAGEPDRAMVDADQQDESECTGPKADTGQRGTLVPFETTVWQL